jgi:transcriptional regulator with PAS, ATPase and Fis domain
MNIQEIKQRFGIIGNSPLLDRALNNAIQVAPTDISVLISGESGTGKEIIPRIIHQLSHRKHKQYIAVNCGAIPEGTIDSELFGHEKGSFTGATASRKGYFEEADGGTIFLDEVAELPLSTQVRLLRVLETGEFMKVGSSKVLKTNVRIVAASNINLAQSIADNKFREDLFYRLNTVQVHLPPLRKRGSDIHLLFRKFAADFGQKYHMPTIRLEDEAIPVLINYQWPGNIRQLRNVVEQLSVIGKSRLLDAETLHEYLPDYQSTQRTPIVRSNEEQSFSEREILYKVLFDMRKDISELKKLTLDLIQQGISTQFQEHHAKTIQKIYEDVKEDSSSGVLQLNPPVDKVEEVIEPYIPETNYQTIDIPEKEETESLSLQDMEIQLIKRALEKHQGKRKEAAKELDISERTLYRKIKQYNL